MKNITMRSKFIFKKTTVFMTTLVFLLCSTSAWTQIITEDVLGLKVTIHNFPDAVCGNEAMVYVCNDCPQDLASLANQVTEAFETIPHANRVKVQSNTPYYPRIQFDNNSLSGGFIPQSPFGNWFPIHTGVDAAPPSATNEYMQSETDPIDIWAQSWNFNAIVNFTKGSTEGYLCIPFRSGSLDPTDPTGSTWFYFHSTIIVPFVVEGPTQPAVAIIDTVVEPQIPYLVLHAPPGGGSSSEFQSNETNCREFNTNFAEEGSNSANLAVKLGVKGSIGFINTVDYEFSVTMSAGFEIGDMSISSNSNQTCISVAEGFSTEALTDNEGGGDVFIGYGTDLVLGLYEYVEVDESTCTASTETGLIYAPTGDPRKFIYTKEAIENEIEELGDIVADSLNNNARVSNNAQNQINVWNQVLSMNTANVNDGNNEFIENLSFSNNVTATNESSISIVETSTIEYEHFISGSVGLEAKLEIAGSGITGGYEYKGAKRFGKSNNASAETSKMLKYTLTDDSEGDDFDVKIVRDPMYGTPIFRVETTSRTSCPYQGGYQRDQPLLTFLDGESEFSLEDIPMGSTGTFQIRICNDSDETRTYYLKGNPNTNLNGAIIEGFGNNLFNTNDQGIEFSVPASDCLDAATLSIKQASSNITDYENIEIFLNVDCQPASASITSSIFLSANFSESTSVSDLEQSNSMSIVPNPNTGQFRIVLEAAVEDGSDIIMKDITGKIISRQNIKRGDRSIMVNHNGLESGVYIVMLREGAQVSTQKVVIN